MTSTIAIHQSRTRNGSATRCVQSRFTVHGTEQLDNRLERICEQVLHGVSRVIPADRLEAILLAGGYGRGEGGVLKCSDGEHPYNDMEFYVFVRGNRLLNDQRFGKQLHELGEQLLAEAGIEIEFKIQSFEKLRASPPSMFYYDLVMGHHWVAGHEGLLAGTEHHREAADIPLHEATRLLMNRASGLLFAREKLDTGWSRQKADFVVRNIAKAKLAMGDAVLTAYGRYHWSCRQRNRRLHDLIFEAPHLGTLCAWHDEGVVFKLNPAQPTSSRESLREVHEEVTRVMRDVFLWLERRRMAMDFADITAYALSCVNKYPESNWPRNLILNFKAFGFGALRRKILRHPRERVLNALALLLWADGCSDLTLLRSIQQALNTKAATFSDCARAYRRLWGNVN